ncbi:MAG: hypothetical protein CM1200mP14_06180 [Gammaproteobacteria bacterium]|nr:MAG: hypothetical protein CM1200mP14_06180 [Gammaproteobacteria bacterium]
MKTFFRASVPVMLSYVLVVIQVGAQESPAKDMMTFPRPIEALDNVWIEELTMLEVRDALKDGKTTALILTGGIEENGPYLTTGKHNHVLAVMGDAIARRLGNALVAPIVTIEPGNPERAGHQVVSASHGETFQAVLRDMSTSLKAQGFKDIFLIGDSGGTSGGWRPSQKSYPRPGSARASSLPTSQSTTTR